MTSWTGGDMGSIPGIYNYAQAVAVFDKIAPKRGHSDSEPRPLGGRTQKQFKILKQGDEVQCILYHTAVVTFKANGDIVLRTGGWATPATAYFMQEVIGWYAESFDGNIWVDLAESKSYIVLKDGLIVRDRVPINPEQTFQKVLNKDRAKVVRTSFKPYTDWVKAMVKLGVSQVYHGDYGRLEFDIDDISTYNNLWDWLGRPSNNRALWNWAYDKYQCYDTNPVPLGRKVKYQK